MDDGREGGAGLERLRVAALVLEVAVRAVEFGWVAARAAVYLYLLL